MLRLTPETFIGTSIVRTKDTQCIPSLKRKNGKGVSQSDLEKAEEFNGLFTDVFNKNKHTRSCFWIGQHLSWMILLFLRME